MNAAPRGLVRVRSTNAVFAPVGDVRVVTKQEASALCLMGNAELVTDAPTVEPEAGSYLRSDLEVGDGPRRGPARKTR